MEGNSGEQMLFETVLPLLRDLFGDEGGSAGSAQWDSVGEFVRHVERLTERDSQVHFPGREMSAAAQEVCHVVLTLTGWTVADIRRWRQGHVALAAHLMTAMPPSRGLLSTRDAIVMRRLLETSCRLVLRFVRWGDSPDAVFEEQYGEYVTAAYGGQMISGVNRVLSQVPLELTYVPSLVNGRAEDLGARARPLEEALAENPRLLLRGEAGAGKTTTLHWHAVRAVREGWPGLSEGSVPVPFVLPVRILAQQGLPGPGELLSAVGCPLLAPRDWELRVLAEGRGILLVDGVDEAPEAERARLRQWLRALCAAYPLTRWLISLRPSAAPEGWLADLGFAEAHVVPLSDADAQAFVRRWYHARGAGDHRSEDAGTREEALLVLLRERSDLASLARNPLMCGALCALHEERAGWLPRTRTELYSALLSTLLRSRDEERGIILPFGDGLSDKEQLALLGDLAYWMVRNGQSLMSHDQALRMIDTSRQRMPRAPGTDEILAYLLARSGVLGSPAEGVVGFVHRTFQDFLAARSLVENGDFELLAEHAHQDQWRNVFLCAMGLARVRERSRLLQLVLECGDETQQRAVALHFHLLAAAGVAEVNELDPSVRGAVRRRIVGHLPPRTPEEAAAFASLGQTVLGLLPAPDQVSREQTGAVLELLGRIPGPEAEEAARRFMPSPGRTALPATSWVFPEPASGARQLAVALSVATRIEPELIRAVRLRMFPLLDAGDEADLWFSPWTAAQTPQAMALRTELLPALRAELAERLAASAPDDPIWQLGRLVERVHTHISPALGVEERLNWLEVTGALTAEGGTASADTLLLPALRALVEEHREGIADWLAGAWPRLPEAVRESTAAWQLVTAALHRVPDVGLEQRPAPPGVTADDVAVIVDAVGDAMLTVSRSGGSLTLGAGVATARDTAILVPDTHPRVVEVLGDEGEGGTVFRTVTIPPGETRSVRVGAGPVRLRTPRGGRLRAGPGGTRWWRRRWCD